MNTDEQIISLMYQGEQRRDASSKIRGYLFQDLVTIEELLKVEVKYICSEYLEDIFVVRETETMIIQVKYYPKKKLKLEEVILDLYYQFLRLKIYGYKDKVVPRLIIYSNEVIERPSLENLRIYANVNRSEKVEYDVNCLEELYKCNKSEKQQKCFNKFANDNSMAEFLKELIISKKCKCIGEYRNIIGDKINQIIRKNSNILDENIRKSIAMGLAIRFVQDSYNEIMDNVEKVVQQRKKSRGEFLKYLQDNTRWENKDCISAYLQDLVYEIWSEKEADNQGLSQKQIETIHIIVKNTANWLFELCRSVEGQKQLINTISRKNNTYIDGFEMKTTNTRLTIMHEHRSEIEDYLCFLWKIIFDINQDTNIVKSNTESQKGLRIENYIDLDEKRVIQLKILENLPASVLLSGVEGGRKREKVRNILSRMKIVKPEIWYLCGEYKGYFCYNQKVSDIAEGMNLNVASINPDKFKIECMNCIAVDYGQWTIIDDCKNTIFSDECFEEKNI